MTAGEAPISDVFPRISTRFLRCYMLIEIKKAANLYFLHGWPSTLLLRIV